MGWHHSQISKVKSKKVSFFLAVICLVVTYVCLVSFLRDDRRPLDFIQYWSAAKLFVNGSNPYNQDLIAEAEREIWQDYTLDPILIWNPPAILSLIFWLERFSYQEGRVIWLMLSIIFIIIALHLTIEKINLDKLFAYVVFANAILWYPLLLSLYDGQITPFIFLFLVIYIVFRQTRPVISACAFSLTLLKPHLFIPFYLYEMFYLFKSTTSLKVSTIFCLLSILCMLALSLSPYIYNAQIYHWYFEALEKPPVYFQTPTLGSFAQEFFAKGFFSTHQLNLRSLPSAIMAVAFMLWFFISKDIFKRDLFSLSLIFIPFGLFFAPYGWIYDQIILLLPLFVIVASSFKEHFTSSGSRYFLRFLPVIISAMITLTPKTWGQQYYWWVTLLVLVASLYVYSSIQKGTICQKMY